MTLYADSVLGKFTGFFASNQGKTIDYIYRYAMKQTRLGYPAITAHGPVGWHRTAITLSDITWYFNRNSQQDKIKILQQVENYLKETNPSLQNKYSEETYNRLNEIHQRLSSEMEKANYNKKAKFR